MRWYRRLFRKVLTEKQLDAELRFHVDQQIADYVAAGMTPEEARRSARLEFGGLDQVKERCRDVGAARFIETIIQDARYGLRQLRRNPGFTAVAIITLALGIGANTAIFSLIEAALFPPFAVNNPNRLAGVYTSGPNRTGYSSTSYPDYIYYRQHNQVFSGLLAYAHFPLKWTHGNQMSFPWAAMVSSNYFTVLGVRPFAGRLFLPKQDSARGASAVAVVSFRFWNRRLASDPRIVGKILTLNGYPFTVVGVVPKHFAAVDLAWGSTPDIWVPMAMQPVVLPTEPNVHPLESREARFLLVMGRLKPHVSLTGARSDMQLVARQLAQAYPVADKGRTVFVLTANESRMWPGWRESVIQVLLLLGVAVAFVLLLACANIANLLLIRACVRQRETTVRLALGASRGRVTGQLLTESVLLAMLGGTAGLLFALFLMRIIPTFQLSFRMPMTLNLKLDHRVLIFTLLLSLVTALIFGLIPAFKASGINLSQSLKDGSHRSSGRGTGRGLRDAIVAVAVALAFLSLIGSGLFIRSLRHLETTDPGFDPHNVLMTTAFLSPNQYSRNQGSRFYAQTLERVSALPGVRSACLAGFRPLSTLRSIVHITLEGQEEPSRASGIAVQGDAVSPGYFRTLGITLLRGRDFTSEDNAAAPQVAIVNKAMAESLWPRQDPIGKRLKIQAEEGYRQIVGIVADIDYHTAWESPEPYMYMPLAQDYGPERTLFVRTRGNPMSYLPEVQRTIGGLDKTVLMYDAGTLEQQVRSSLSQPRMMAALLTLFGSVALVLALVGIYGVVSYSVADRTHEIGIRMALGAQKHDVLRLIVGQGMILALIGVGIGALAALASTRLMTSLLYGAKATDPLTFVLVSLLLMGVALLASYVPARRAAKVDPTVALRHE